MRTDNPAAPITISELCAATRASFSRIDFLIDIGVVVPASSGQGRGNRRHYTVENILEVSLAEELTKARFSGHQLQQVAATVRASVAHLSPAARIVARHRFHVAAVQHLAEIFGRGAGYNKWLKDQTHQLRRMERELTRAGDDAGPALDARLLDLFLAAKPAEDELPALAG